MNLFYRVEAHYSRLTQWISAQLGKPSFFMLVLLFNVWMGIEQSLGRLSGEFITSVGAWTGNISILLLALLQATTIREGKERKIEAQELIRATDGARNQLLHLSKMTEKELDEISEDLDKAADQEAASHS